MFSTFSEITWYFLGTKSVIVLPHHFIQIARLHNLQFDEAKLTLDIIGNTTQTLYRR